MPALLGIVVGLSVGLLTGGRASNLSRVRFRHPWVLLGAFLVQAAVRGRLAGVVEGSQPWAPVVWAAACFVAMLALAPEIRSAGIPIVIAGMLSNLVVVLANGAMPVTWPNGAPASLPPMYVLAGPATRLAFLGDAFVVRGYALSIGDVLLLTGSGLFAYGATKLVPQHERDPYC